MPNIAGPYFQSLMIALVFLHSACAQDRASSDSGASQRLVIDAHGAIIRGDVSKKQIALVFTGDEFADGGNEIRKCLRRNNIKGSFFLTGNFYKNPAFSGLIKDLKKDGHYLGAHSDKHLLYADWTKRDSLLVSRKQFTEDLLENYKHMERFGVKPSDALYFIPPFEWYNSTIAQWTSELGFRLINFSPGTRSAADYTYPEMGDRYLSSDDIYRSVIQREETDPHGLNGFILLVHIGTDPRRKDKFYNRLDDLVAALKSRHYTFVSITELLNHTGIGANNRK